MWSSRLAFILAATGSAVGLGNIWRFPYTAGEYGGGAFVLVYLLCVAGIGIPIMIAEIMLGRRGRQSPINTMRTLAEREGASGAWQLLGWMGILSGFLILSFYSVIAGWTLAYVFRAGAGGFTGIDAEQSGAMFSALVADPERLLAWHTIFMVMVILVVARGVASGLEKAVRFLMPALFLLLVVMVLYAAQSGDFAAGVSYLFTPDFDKLSAHAGEAVLSAMGQAFFTLSLGMGAMITYGSYLGDRESVPGSALMVALLDTAIALLASIAIFTIVFQYDLDPKAAGPGLVFQVLPLAFSQMPGGRFIGTAFFLLLAFAALTSAISLLEVVVAHFIDDRKWARRTATVIMGTVIWGLGLFSAFSYNLLENVTLLEDKEGQGMPILDSVDLIATNYMLPIGGFFIALFAGWFIKQQVRDRQLLDGSRSPAFYRAWLFVTRYFTPVAVGLLILFMIDKHLGIAEWILGGE